MKPISATDIYNDVRVPLTVHLYITVCRKSLFNRFLSLSSHFKGVTPFKRNYYACSDFVNKEPFAFYILNNVIHESQFKVY